MSRSQELTDKQREYALRTAGLRKPMYQYESKVADKPPSYDRVVVSLSERELREEIELGRGEPGYQEALRNEARKRGLEI